MRDPEFLVIGAGAAGIAAARTLTAAGREVMVLEGGPRVGGRAHTTHALGSPLDLGATWLHEANNNPLTAFAHDALNHDDVRERHLWLGSRWATPAELDDYAEAEDAFYEALAAGTEGPDRPVSEVVPSGGSWDATVRHWQGAQIQAMEVERLSTHDQVENELDDPNLLLPEGIGTLLTGLAEGLPIRLNSPVERLDWSGPGVVAEGPFGRIRAKAAIITVSTGVLSADSLRFTPELPLAHREAIDGLPMALLTKFGFRCADRLGIEPFHTIRKAVTAADPRPLSFIMWPFGRDHFFGFVGGEFAWELARAGDAATLAAGAAEFRSIFGPVELGASTLSDWGTNPLFLGSYSQARPGHAGARARLAEPVGPLLFAGEATALGLAGTVGGAWREGERAARALIAGNAL
ncbi:FAD-dependent oxidoreductase [Acetobacteraceae bacterium H6797]|nr:FAD-dependent oxidoreductase [Acetobacteraceae bacterium H6797]